MKYGIWHMDTPLERQQERDDVRPRGGRQSVEGVSRERATGPRVALDRIVEGGRQPVVHQLGTRADAPERRSAQHVPRACSAVLDDPVARPDVVQQEVAEQADVLIAQSRRDSERALVDHRAWRGGVERGRVTDRAPYRPKQSLAASGGGGDWAAARRPGLSHESCERFHVIAIVLRIGDSIKSCDRSTQGVVLTMSVGSQGSAGVIKGIGDPHLVEVSVAGEGEQAGVLVLPPEAAGAKGSVGLDHRNRYASPLEGGRLVNPVGLDGVTVDGLYEAIANSVESGAEISGVYGRDDLYALLDGRRDRPKLKQRRVLAWRGSKDAADSRPNPQFPDLALAAEIRGVVAIATTRGVIDRP